MNSADILIYKVLDWEGLYVNGECVMENQSLDTDTILSFLIGYTIQSVTEEYSIWEGWWLHDYLPKHLSEIPDEALEHSKNKELILSYRQ